MTKLEEQLKTQFTDATDAELQLASLLAGNAGARVGTEQIKVRGEVISWLLTEPACRTEYSSNFLRVHHVRVTGPLQLDDIVADFVIEFDDCVIEEPLSIERAKLHEVRLKTSKLEAGLRGGGVRVAGDFIMLGVASYAAIVLDDARIEGTFVLAADDGKVSTLAFAPPSSDQGSALDPEYDVALSMARIRIGGSCVVAAEIAGLFRLKHCRLEADLVMEGAHVSNPGRCALDLEGAEVGGSCLLTPQFKASGLVRLLHAQIECLLNASGARLEHPQLVGSGNDTELMSLDARDAHIQGPCLLWGGFCAAGAVSFYGAHLESDCWCDGGTFQGLPEAFTATQARIDGTLALAGSGFAGKVSFALGQCARLFVSDSDGAFLQKADLDLRYARCEVLHVRPNSWFHFKRYALEGLQYVAVWGGDDADQSDWANWLSESKEPISLDAYEQLAKVLGAAGDSDSRQKVLIAKEELRATRLDGWPRARHWAWKVLAGYGHKPWYALVPLAVVLALGCALVKVAPDGTFFRAKERMYVESKRADKQAVVYPAYPTLDPLAYSLDALVPFLDLHQEEYWRPDTREPWGRSVELYFLFHTAFGWFFATIGLAAIARLVKRD